VSKGRPERRRQKGTLQEHKTTAADFAKVCEILKSKAVIFSKMMDTTGSSYGEAMCLKNLFDPDTKGKAFEPQKTKNRDAEKIAAFYHFTATELDIEASAFKEAIKNQNYVEDQRLLNIIYDFYHGNLLKADGRRYQSHEHVADTWQNRRKCQIWFIL
jgi:hypothetical protein